MSDLTTAKTERDRALEQVASHGPAWRSRALQAISLIRAGYTGTAEDIRIKLMVHGLDRPHHHNAWGEVMKTAITKKIILPTGEMRHMKGSKSHARRTPVYRKT